MKSEQQGLKRQAEKEGHEILLTIVYDNNPGDEDLTASWGFACVIGGLPKTILFDTGGSGNALLGNMKELEIRPGDIDVVVLSHIHGDHVGGLGEFLKQNNDVAVFLPAAFPEGFKSSIRRTGARVVETDKARLICAGACTTGVLDRGIKEQGLCVETARGIAVITGCAHPGVANLARAAKENTDKPMFAVLGGFHMGGASAREISLVIQELKDLGITQVGPCHCSGDKTRKMMQEAFGGNYLDVHVGSRLRFDKPKIGRGEN